VLPPERGEAGQEALPVAYARLGLSPRPPAYGEERPETRRYAGLPERRLLRAHLDAQRSEIPHDTTPRRPRAL
jgi:hypothetical protein